MKTKHLLFLIALVLFRLNGFSQYTLTSSNYGPVPGWVDHNSVMDTTGAEPGAAGANQTWDLTSLVLDSTHIQNWVAPSATPYASLFPTATVASAITYGFWNMNASQLLQLGSVVGGDTLIYSKPVTYVTFPFSYLSTSNGTFKGTSVGTSGSMTVSGTMSTTADAWGTLKLPEGVYTNILRTKSVETDTMIMGAMTLIDITTTYYYCSSTSRAPLLGIFIDEFNYMGIISYMKRVVMIPAGTGINDMDAQDNNIVLYPNPVSNNLAVGTTLKAEISIINTQGQLVRALSTNGNLTNIDVSDLSNGVYIMKVKTEKGIEMKKFVKE